MAQRDDLTAFVREALVQGHAREAIAAALARAGWTQDEAQAALQAFADEPFSPPIPQPRPIISARDFFVYVLMFGALIFAATYLVILLHHMIDAWLSSSSNSRIRGMRWAIAMLLVSVPLYAGLNVLEERRVRAAPGRSRSALRKWATYLTLLVAATVLAGDLVWTIYALLNGDLTLAFALKVITVGIVAGWIFLVHRGRAGEGL